jgi:hypothetical protein
VGAYLRAMDWYVDFARARYRPLAMVDGSDPLRPRLVTGPEMARVQRAGTSRVLILERVDAASSPDWAEPFDPLCGQSALIPPGSCQKPRAVP